MLAGTTFSGLTWVYVASLWTALAPKPWVKKSEKPQLLQTPVVLPFITLALVIPGEYKDMGGGIFIPFLLHNPLHGFSSAVQHIRTDISLEAFILYETGRTIMSY